MTITAHTIPATTRLSGTMRIRARAIKRAGELLKSIAPKAAAGRPKNGGGTPTITGAAKNAGLSRDQKVTALRVASVPDDEFEEDVESDNPPTVTALAEQGSGGFGDAVCSEGGRP